MEREKRNREGSSRFIYIQADFQLSKIRRNESTAGSVRTRGTRGGAWSGFIFAARMSCRSFLSCLLFLFRAWISSFGSSSGFLRRRFAFHSSRANVRRLPHEYFVKRTRPNTRKNGNGRRWTLSPSRADENYPAFQWPLIFTRPLKRSISRSFFLFFQPSPAFFPCRPRFYAVSPIESTRTNSIAFPPRVLTIEEWSESEVSLRQGK